MDFTTHLFRPCCAAQSRFDILNLAHLSPNVKESGSTVKNIVKEFIAQQVACVRSPKLCAFQNKSRYVSYLNVPRHVCIGFLSRAVPRCSPIAFSNQTIIFSVLFFHVKATQHQKPSITVSDVFHSFHVVVKISVSSLPVEWSAHTVEVLSVVVHATLHVEISCSSAVISFASLMIERTSPTTRSWKAKSCSDVG